MFPILSVKDLNEFVDLAGRFHIERLYATVFKEDRRPGFPDPARPQEVQVQKFLTMILTAPANIVEGVPTILRFWTTKRVETEAEDLELRYTYLVRQKAVEMALSVEVCRGYLTFLGDPSIIPGSVNGLEPSLLQEAESAIKAQFGAMAGSQVTRDQIEAEKPATGLETGQEAPPEAPEEPEPAPEPDSPPDEALEVAESDTVSLSEGPPDDPVEVTTGDPEDPQPVEKGDDYEEVEGGQVDLRTPADPPSEEPEVKTLEDFERETPNLEDQFKK